MAQAVPIIGAIFSLVGQMRQASAQEKAAEQQAAAAEEAQRISTMNAARIEAETAEMARREREASEEAQSQRRLVAAAAGGTGGGSTAAYLEEQAERESRYIDWLERSGASRASIARAEGGYARQTGMITAEATRSRASQSRMGAVGSLFDIYKGIKSE